MNLTSCMLAYHVGSNYYWCEPCLDYLNTWPVTDDSIMSTLKKDALLIIVGSNMLKIKVWTVLWDQFPAFNGEAKSRRVATTPFCHLYVQIWLHQADLTAHTHIMGLLVFPVAFCETVYTLTQLVGQLYT